MVNIKKLIKLDLKELKTKNLVIYLFIAYIFSLSIRLFLYYQVSDNNTLFYNGDIIPIWTPDTGLYGYYAKQLLSGVSYPFISEYNPAYLLYFIVKLTGISLDTALFILPAFLSSLIVIPIILIANHYKLINYGLYGGIIGSLMTSYYYRTHLGYYDTDILNAFFPLLAIYFLIKLVDRKKIINALYASITLTLFYLWYHSSLSIIIAIIFTFFIYISIFNRAFILRYKSYFIAFAILIVATLSFVDISKHYERTTDYINKSSNIVVDSKDGELRFKSDLDNVSEAKNINILELSHRVSGAIPYFILAIIGYLALIIRYRSMLLTLPLVIITFLSMVSGLRFTIYGVTLFSFSMVFGVYIVFKNILVTWGDFPQNVSNITSRIFLAFVAIFAINSVFEYNKRVSPIFFSSNRDIKELDSLKERLKEDDFVLTYWDYGWPLWYYLNRNNTLIDNGKHQQDNFIVSKILLSSNQTFSRNSSIFFIEKYIEGREKGFFRVMDYFVKNYPIEYLDKLKKPDFKLPKSKRDIYILLHKNMISTLATIESDSNIDLKTGKSYGSSYMDMGYLNKKFDSSQKELETFDGFKIDIEKGVIKDKQNSTNFRKIVVFEDGKIEFEKSYITSKREYLLIYQGKVLFMKPKLYNSFLIQALLFGNYNRDYFTEISKTDNFLILKINREYN